MAICGSAVFGTSVLALFFSTTGCRRVCERDTRGVHSRQILGIGAENKFTIKSQVVVSVEYRLV